MCRSQPLVQCTSPVVSVLWHGTCTLCLAPCYCVCYTSSLLSILSVWISTNFRLFQWSMHQCCAVSLVVMQHVFVYSVHHPVGVFLRFFRQCLFLSSFLFMHFIQWGSLISPLVMQCITCAMALFVMLLVWCCASFLDQNSQCDHVPMCISQ